MNKQELIDAIAADTDATKTAVGRFLDSFIENVQGTVAKGDQVTLTGFGTDVAGELGLQAFYSAQLPGPLPFAILSAGLLNTMFFAIPDRSRRMDAIATGWERGKRARPLFGVRWSDHWTTPLSELRQQFNIDPVAA